MRYTATVFACAGAMIFAAQPANAETSEVLANMAAEATTCAVYFGFAEKMLSGSNEAVAGRYRAAQKRLLVWALTLTKYSGLKPETVDATMQLQQRRMLARIDGNMGNISILINEYGETCREVEKNPAKRSLYWVDRLSR